MKSWETPGFECIDMNAEIGAHQADFQDDDARDPRLATPKTPEACVGPASDD